MPTSEQTTGSERKGSERKSGERKSKRFEVGGWAERLAPVLLAVLVLGLLATLVIVGLSMLGLTPGF